MQKISIEHQDAVKIRNKLVKVGEKQRFLILNAGVMGPGLKRKKLYP